MMQRISALNSSNVPFFNFSLSHALKILEEHSLKDQVFESTTEVLIIVPYAILMASGLCCNLMVCCVVLSNSKIRHSRNALVVNLNFADMLLCVFCMPFTLLVLIRRSWVLGDALCKLVPFVQASTVFVSAATVFAVAVDRYKVVLSLNPHRPRPSRNDINISTFLIWVCSLALSTPMCIFRRTIPVQFGRLHMYYKCIERWPSASSKVAYAMLTVVVQFVIPAIMLLITHVQIKYHLNTHAFHEANRDSLDNDDERLRKDLKRNGRATMVLLIISVVFFVSWLPWNLLNLVVDLNPYLLSPNQFYSAFTLCHMLAMTSSVSNPILYGWLNSNIRREMVRLAKAGTAFVSSRSSHSDNAVVQQFHTMVRSSVNESIAGNRPGRHQDSQF